MPNDIPYFILCFKPSRPRRRPFVIVNIWLKGNARRLIRFYARAHEIFKLLFIAEFFPFAFAIRRFPFSIRRSPYSPRVVHLCRSVAAC